MWRRANQRREGRLPGAESAAATAAALGIFQPMREAQRFLIHELGGHVSDALAMETRLAMRQREWQEEQAVRAFERAAAERGIAMGSG